ncbi:MAG: porin family protein [Bacteroidales bacterium]|nr:porin family protein [Bacteroidales bacterium]
MKRISIFIILIALFTTVSFSQESIDKKYFKRVKLTRAGLLNMKYVMGFPTGDFTDFINESSYRGFNIEYRRFLNDNISVGGYTGWNGFYEKTDRATYNFDNGAITGVLYNYFYVLPIYANVHYYFFPGDIVQPFVGLGFGALYVNKESQMGVLSVYDDSWHFGLAPEIGFFVPFAKNANSGVITSGRYNQASYKEGDFSSLRYFQWTIGLSVFL